MAGKSMGCYSFHSVWKTVIKRKVDDHDLIFLETTAKQGYSEMTMCEQCSDLAPSGVGCL